MDHFCHNKICDVNMCDLIDVVSAYQLTVFKMCGVHVYKVRY